MQPNAYWETFLEAVPSRQRCPCSLCMNSTVMEMLVQIQDIWHGGCLQTSWLEANFYPLLKIKKQTCFCYSAVWLHVYCVYFSPTWGQKHWSLSLSRADRPTDSVGGERGEQGMWALGLPDWGSCLQGDGLSIQQSPWHVLSMATQQTLQKTPDLVSSPQTAAGVGGGGKLLRLGSLKHHK